MIPVTQQGNRHFMPSLMTCSNPQDLHNRENQLPQWGSCMDMNSQSNVIKKNV